MPTVLLVVSSFFPDPHAGGVRATQWAKLLSELGWRVVVARKNHGYSARKEEIDRNVHPSVEIRYLSKGPSPFAAQRLGRFGAAKMIFAKTLERYLLAPDPGIVFWSRAFRSVCELVEEVQPDVVITTGPPHSLHTIGMRLKEIFPHIPWLADFRDTFRQGASYHTGFLESYRSRKNLSLEREIYRKADRITCTVEAHKRWIRKRFPEEDCKTTVLLNGVPDELCCRGDIFVPRDNAIKVVGFSEAEETVTLAEAVAAVRKAGTEIGLRVVGRLPTVAPRVERLLGDAAIFTGPVSHDKALEEISSARVLVAILSEKRSRLPAIASKLFEYLAVPVPVIVINPSAAARSLFCGLPGVWMIKKPTPEDLRGALIDALRVSNNELQTRAADVQSRWSRRSQTRELAGILDDLCSTQTAR